jgi:hypothetical protein
LADLDSISEMLAPFNLIGSVVSQPRDSAPSPANRVPWYRRWFAAKA